MTTRPAHSPRSSAVGLAQVCSAGLLWGTGGLVVTVLHEEDGLGAMTTSAWRMLIAAAALVAFAVLTRRWRTVVATFRKRPVVVVLAGCLTAIYQGLYFLAVLAAGVSVATVVSLGLAPVLAATWEHARARTRPSPRELAVLAAALVGLLLVSTASTGHGGAGDQPVLGLLLAVASGAVYAATTVLGHHLARDVDPVALTTCATGAGTVLLAPFLVVAALGDRPVATSRPEGWLLLVYLGVATMALSYGLLYAGLRTTSGSAATVATLVEPLSAAALAALLLDERLTATALVGGALILAAVVGLRPREVPPTAT
ncbi:DMT family transporter [Aeromicrobium alkaliterrae]|uniref:EamA family transporter n=1 Tax=Aeromicrobium alkaliterrae TaxID=302168 RepID=A0ABN2JYY3_9ACTN